MTAKKIFIIFLTLCLLFTRAIPVSGIEGVPTPPPAPTAPEAPPAPTLQEMLAPTAAPTAAAVFEPTPTPELSQTTPTPTPGPSPTLTPLESGEIDSSQSGVSQTGLVGNVSVQTGEATTSVTLTVAGNTGLSAADSEGSVSETADDSNAAALGIDETITIVEESSVSQINQATVGNSLEQTTATGGNSVSLNVGNSSINTGDANTLGTIIAAVNTNVSGVSVSEFNVVDDHKGDIVLDFVSNSSNSANLVNSVNSSVTFQYNESFLENNLVLVSDTGNNEADLNTNGNTTIETGNANVSALVLSFVNNNLAGNVILGVVNIFGNLVGDIILPKEQLAQNTDCGSTNRVQEVNILDTQETFQSNDADIENNLVLVANTGGNEASRNTGGQTTIETGEARVETRVVNVANSNVSDGSWWLVIVNQAGEWIGKILGSPDGTNIAGSEGAEVRVDENGQVTASQDKETVSQEKTANVEQTNQASIKNNIELTANTGSNRANDNTGGNTTIKTGDAKIIASIINFVNNSIASEGRLVVAIVNVFGNWIGDFLPPGYEKDNNDDNNGDDEGNDNDDGEENHDENHNGGSDNGDSDNGGDEEGGSNNSGGDGNNDGNGGKNDPQIALSTPRRLKGGNFVYTSLETYELPEGKVIAAQSHPFVSPEKPVRINLAWLTLTIPLFLLLGLIRRIAFQH